MHAIDFVHPEPVEQAILHHCQRTQTILLVRLEDKMHGSVETVSRGKGLGSGQQHRRMAIVATAVKLRFIDGTMIEIISFLNRQRIDVRAQADGAIAFATLQNTNDSSPAYTGMGVDTHIGQQIGNYSSRPFLPKTEFGVSVDIASPGDPSASCIIHDVDFNVTVTQTKFAGLTRSD